MIVRSNSTNQLDQQRGPTPTNSHTPTHMTPSTSSNALQTFEQQTTLGGFTSAPIATLPLSQRPITRLELVKLQIEYYFSPINLSKDAHLRSLMNSRGYVPIVRLLEFPRLRTLAYHALDVLTAARTSQFLTTKNGAIRSRYEWKNHLPESATVTGGDQTDEECEELTAINLGQTPTHQQQSEQPSTRPSSVASCAGSSPPTPAPLTQSQEMSFSNSCLSSAASTTPSSPSTPSPQSIPSSPSTRVATPLTTVANAPIPPTTSLQPTTVTPQMCYPIPVNGTIVPIPVSNIVMLPHSNVPHLLVPTNFIPVNSPIGSYYYPTTPTSDASFPVVSPILPSTTPIPPTTISTPEQLMATAQTMIAAMDVIRQDVHHRLRSMTPATSSSRTSTGTNNSLNSTPRIRPRNITRPNSVNQQRASTPRQQQQPLLTLPPQPQSSTPKQLSRRQSSKQLSRKTSAPSPSYASTNVGSGSPASTPTSRQSTSSTSSSHGGVETDMACSGSSTTTIGSPVPPFVFRPNSSCRVITKKDISIPVLPNLEVVKIVPSWQAKGKKPADYSATPQVSPRTRKALQARLTAIAATNQAFPIEDDDEEEEEHKSPEHEHDQEVATTMKKSTNAHYPNRFQHRVGKQEVEQKQDA